uniref:Uncharacterized protein n=1 Tax=Panagrolaimus davidi TaxID=227884 RepID=A0A914QG87_9BILA
MHQNEPTCVDRHEQIKCHEHISQENLQIETYSNFTACAGVNQISMGNRFISAPRSIEIKQSQIPKISQYMLKTFHSSELFVKCPKCKKTTVPFRWAEKCMVKLSTIEYGWPSKMYECDNMLEVPDSECDKLKKDL